ncbi:MAG: SEC-C domain-containing protein [Planctomycetales bacterium]|nr:SEC-C domain-containing protein [Planctomycetales bacterium]MBN8625862.1 SEC-C domain-containing protein [Planctomycetota bacterium]
MTQVLSAVGDLAGNVFGGFGRSIERSLTALFGSSNARYIKKLQPKVAAINDLESKYQGMTDDELRQQTERFKERLASGQSLDDILAEAFAVCREASRRFIGLRHYDVQLIGGMVLHSGAIGEMATGEGKTLVATLPAYLNALEGKGVHVVTVNSYLARRDMEWMGPVYMGLGLTVGAIYNDMDPLERQRAYMCDITYGTNNEFGFDYLRDNMKPAAHGDKRFPPQDQQVQRKLHYAIIDEVDNILVDEARTPLIISGPAHDDVERYSRADKIAKQLKRDVHFEVKEKEHTAHLTEDGIREAERLAGVESFYTAGNMDWPHLIDNSLKAYHLYKRDVNYVVQDGEVIIVDEFTGRLMQGRQWSDGLHQAVEAKEGVKIKKESQTYATVTLQNFFKMYKKISGMTGTAMTEAAELWKIYKLDVIAIPTNKTAQRINHPDVIYMTEGEKFEAICDEIEALHRWDQLDTTDGKQLVGTIVREEPSGAVVFQMRESKDKEAYEPAKIQNIRRKGRPILVGTVSIEKSERLGAMLSKRGVKHEVLNAKHHQREAEIISQAGRLNAVTIATNMAGRGTDIILGGNPETMAWGILQSKYESRLDVPQDEWTKLVHEIEQREKMKPEGEVVRKLGGLHVLGTERHEARRIDLQLRGRCGRQGDPGSSRFFLSLEDDLMRIFAGEWVKNMLSRLGMQKGEAIESRMVSRRIEGAQKKVEERNFDIRKNLLEYDEVMDEQRKRVYGFRQQLLEGVNCKYVILDMIKKIVDLRLDEMLDVDYGTSTYAKWAGHILGIEFKPRDFRGLDGAQAERLARDEAQRQVETQLHDAIDENLPEGEEETEWNWEALAKFVDTRWGLSLRDRDLKKVGRDGVAEMIMAKVTESIEALDLTEGGKFLDREFPIQSVSAWMRQKFGIEVSAEELRGLDAPAVKKLILARVVAAYDEKEAEYPVLAGLLHFSRGTGEPGQRHIDREAVVGWARERFRVEMSLEDLKSKQREDIRDTLIAASKKFKSLADAALEDAKSRVDRIFGNTHDANISAEAAGSREHLASLAAWLQKDLESELTVEQLGEMNRETLERRVTGAVEDFYRPEIRGMERRLVLFVLDAAWKDHLLAMDHLRSSVSMRSYAQVDPKVEYRREGMRTFETMWDNIGDQVTDMVFRVEQLNEDFIGSTWVESKAVHESPPTAGADEQQAAVQGSEQSGPVEPIRNHGPQVGRNDPCPCGSGKKYKQCCMRKDNAA